MTNDVAQPKANVSIPRQALNITALGTVVTVNALANIIPFNGQTTGEISDSFNSLVTPAGYVFSIWGVIYALLAVFVVYQALPGQKNNPRLESLGNAFIANSVFNVAWIFAWHFNQLWLSELFMLGLLASLIAAYLRLGIGKTKVSRTEWFTTRLPFSIYLGWITAATILNTTVLLLSQGVTGGSVSWLWGIIMIAAALSIAALILRRRGDVAYAAVLVWAFAGIAVAEWGITPAVVVMAILAAAALTGFVGLHLQRTKVALG